jgi:predicted RNase H-like HicB family nuclease
VRDLGVESPAAGAAGGSDIHAAIERLREVISDGGSNKAATGAMANLAEAIQGLVHHMRSEQQLIREWVDGQAVQHREIRRLLEMLSRAPAHRD